MSDAYVDFLHAKVHDVGLLAYVLARVVEDGDCLRWTGWSANGHPAGTIAGRRMLIRRELYKAAHGPIREGKIVRCNCETPDCVNPEHATLTTYKAVAKQLGAEGVMSGPVRSARIAAVKRAGKQAKITQKDARAIRASDEPLRVLAARYGLSKETCSKIRRGQVQREFAGNPWAGLGA